MGERNEKTKNQMEISLDLDNKCIKIDGELWHLYKKPFPSKPTDFTNKESVDRFIRECAPSVAEWIAKQESAKSEPTLTDKTISYQELKYRIGNLSNPISCECMDEILEHFKPKS